MKKSSVLDQLKQLKALNENRPADELELTPMQIVAILLAYINDPEVSTAVDEIVF